MNTNILNSYREFENARKYWECILEEDISELKIQTDYPKTKDCVRAQYKMEFDGELCEKLLAFSKNQGLLLYIILMTGIKVLLYKYTGELDIIVASPVYNDEEIEKFNKYIVLRDSLKEEMSFKDLLMGVKQTVSEGFKNQHYPLKKLIDKIEDKDGSLLMLKVALGMDGIHKKVSEGDVLSSSLNYFNFSASSENNKIIINTTYNSCLFKEDTIKVLCTRFESILKQALGDLNKKIRDFSIITEEEKKKILFDFNNTKTDYPHDKTIHKLFEEQVAKTPNNIAVVFKDKKLTYSELDKEANRLANYLIIQHDLRPETLVGLFIENSIDQIVAILGILKAGGAYVPIGTSLPLERIKTIINDSEMSLMISTGKNIKMLNKLQWECNTLKSFLCIDTKDVYAKEEQESGLMDRKLWEYIGENASDEITGGGWASSYTGEALSKEEMDEYGDNVLKKLKPYLNSNTRVLEIGCASGISMFRIAPHVGMYYGTDLSGVIIEKDREKAKRENYENIKLECLPAHEIDKVDEKDFDVIIINSVVQAFSGHNYLRQVIKKSVNLLGEKGILFIGDIMDQEKKYDLLHSLIEFKKKNPGFDTKTDISEELFVSRGFFEDMKVEIDEIKKVHFSNKIHTIENELTRYRYDAVMEIDKERKEEVIIKKNRYQYDLRDLENFDDTCPQVSVGNNNLAYIIYTSGTTGVPKGVMLEHKGVANLKSVWEGVIGLGEKDRVIHFANISFDASVWDIFSGLLTGATLYIMPEDVIGSYTKFEDFLNKNGITFGTLPPTYLTNLDPLKVNSLKKLITAGSTSSIDLFTKWKDKVEYTNGYGPTESTVCTTLWKYDQGTEISNSVPIGSPANNIRVYVVDKYNNLQPIGVEGELCVAGVSLARGYLKRPQLTGEKFIESSFLEGERMYKTGDLARWLPDGNLEFSGRQDGQVKVRGFRIETSEIEFQILQYGGIKEVAVVGIGNEDKYLCAYFTAHEKITIPHIKEFLEKRLPDYMVPSYFVQMDNMPLNSNSKIDIKALPHPQGGKVLEVLYTEPQNFVEEELVKIWRGILGVERIGIDHDFFELGGHSLKATALVTNIHKVFNIEIQLKEVFEFRTIRELAVILQKEKKSIHTSIEEAKVQENYPKGCFPVSSAQRRLYIVNQYEGIGTGYNMPGAVEIEGKIQKERLEKTFDLLIERHESLRTSFLFIEGEIYQKIHSASNLDIQYINLSNEIEENITNENKSIEKVIKEFVRPFDLSCAPLLRVGLVQTGMDKYVLIFDMHHIISDGMSMNVLIKEFAYLYCGEELPLLPIQYKDYAVWQNRLFESEAIKKQEEYWLDRFEGDIPVLDMPHDFPRPNVQSFEGDKINFKLDRELIAGLNELVLKTGTTLYMVMFAAYNILLSKYTGQEDIVVGSPTAGRNHTDLEGIIGFFINTIALRNYPKESKKIIEFIKEVKENILSAFQNGDYQYEQLVEKLNLPRDLSRNPLFDTMFVMQNISNSEINIKDLKFAALDINYKTSKFDLKMEAMEWKDEIRMAIEYKTDLFEKRTMENLARHYICILKSIIKNPNAYISEVGLMEEKEEKDMLLRFNQSITDKKDIWSLKQIFEEQVANTPDKIALICGDVKLTFRQLNNMANGLAWLLMSKGTKRGDIIGILTEQSYKMVIGILGVLKAGAAYLPLDTEFPKERIQYILEDCGAKILLSNGEFSKMISFKGEVINLDDNSQYKDYIKNPQDTRKNTDPAYVIYTSGTTGKPKGVIIEDHNLVNYVNWFKNKFNISTEDKTAIVSSLCFDLAYTAFYSALMCGSQMHLVAKEEYSDPQILIPYLKENKITYIKLTPSLFNVIVNSPRFAIPDALNNLRLVVLGGEKINVNDVEMFNKLYPDTVIVNHYGPTETTIGAIAHTIDFNVFDLYKGHPLIGKPIDNMRVYILDKNLKPVPVGVRGEIYISGEGVARGYLKRPDLNKERFIANPFKDKYFDSPNPFLENFNSSNSIKGECFNSSNSFKDENPNSSNPLKDENLAYSNHSFNTMYRTGDIGRYLEDGSIEFIARVDNQVKIRGYRIETGEIENVLLRYKSVSEAFVTVKEDESSHMYIVAYMVCSEEPKEKDIREFMAKELPQYMIPSYFVKIEKMPLTPNGKVDKKALREPQKNKALNYEEPSNEIEVKLLRIWQEILNTKEIGINDNFFEKGGHSLKATVLANRIHKAFNVEIQLKNIFTSGTIKNLARFIRSSENSIYSSITPVKEESYYPLSSAQRRMFVLNRIEEKGVTYNLPGVIEVKGNLCREGFEKAFNDLVRRHESLRTSFELVNEKPVQIIHEYVDMDMDMGMEYTEVFEKEVNEIIRGFIRPFDLREPRLFRVKLVKVLNDGSINEASINEGRYILMYDMHHIISDGVSRKILIDEFFSLYMGKHLEPLRLQYKDFAAWQNHLYDSDEIKKKEEYWLEKFKGDIPVINLPTDFERPDIKSFMGNNLSFKAGKEMASQLKSLTLNTGTTLYMVLLAGYKILLSRYSGQEDLIVGSPVAGRPHADLENVIGMFVNMISIRSFPKRDKTFMEYLEEVREDCLKAYENQDYQYEELVEKLSVKRNMSRNPLFDVSFTLQNLDIEVTDVEGLKFQPYRFENSVAKFDLTLWCGEGDGNIDFILEYCTSLFKKDTIERMSKDYIKILESVLQDPDIKIKDIKLENKYVKRDKVLKKEVEFSF